MKRAPVLTALAITTMLAGAGIGVSYAATTADTSGPMNNLVTAIASKFNLDQSEVQQVFDDTMKSQRDAMKAEQQQAAADRLAQAVTDGKLTQEQSDKITAKQAELEAERESITPPDRAEMSNLSDEERQAKHEEMKATMDAKQDELKQWAEENDVPEEYLHVEVGGKHGPGGRNEGKGERGGYMDIEKP